MPYVDRSIMQEAIQSRTVFRCGVCGTIKPLEAFYADTSRADGREYRCIDCVRTMRNGERPQRRSPGPPKQYPRTVTVRMTDAEGGMLDGITAAAGETPSEVIRRLVRQEYDRLP